MKQHLLDKPLLTIGAEWIIILSDREPDGEDKHDLTNTPGIFSGTTHDGTPYMFIAEKVKSLHDGSVDGAAQALAAVLDVRKLLGKDQFKDRPYRYEITTDAYRQRVGSLQYLNSRFTENQRKQLYKVLMCNKSVLNVDGIVFTATRKNGTVTLTMGEQPSRCVHSWDGVLDGHGFFSTNDRWVDYASYQNEKKFPNLKTFQWKRWPKELRPISINDYTGLNSVLADHRSDKPTTLNVQDVEIKNHVES